MDMKVLAVISQKGGSGKTMLSTHLAALADDLGYKTLLLDLDQQASSLKWADRRASETLFTEPAQPSRLGRALEEARKGGFDFIIIDTPGSTGPAAMAAAEHADAILIPCQPAQQDLDAIGDTITIAKNAHKPFYVVCNIAPARGDEAEEMAQLLATKEVTMCPVVIHQYKDFKRGDVLGLTAMEIAPRGKARSEAFRLFLWTAEKLGFPVPDLASAPAIKAA